MNRSRKEDWKNETGIEDEKELSMQDREELFLSLRDAEWPPESVSHDRLIVRAIVADAEGMYNFVRVERDDEFGNCTLIETSGGGVEPGEDLLSALKRELWEESLLSLPGCFIRGNASDRR